MEEAKIEALEKIKEKKWQKAVERDVPVLILSLIMEGSKQEPYARILGEISEMGYGNVNKYVVSTTDSKDQILNALKKILASEGYKGFMDIANQCYDDAKIVHDYGSGKDSDDLTERFSKFVKEFSRLPGYLMSVFFSEILLEKDLEALIKENTSNDEDYQKYFEALSSIKKALPVAEEADNILEIALLMKKEGLEVTDDKIEGKIADHISRFGFLKNRWRFEGGYTTEEISQRVSQAAGKDPQAELDKINQARTSAESLTQEFIEKNDLSDEQKMFIEVVKEFVHLRTFRTDAIYHSLYKAKDLFTSIAQKVNLSLDDLLFLTCDEVLNLLSDGGDYSALIAERKEKFYLVLVDDILAVFSGEDIKAVDETGAFDFDKANDSGMVKGNPAWKGKITGTVKVVKELDDCKKVEEGDILVAVMTFPQYIMAMEKASAFVTDEGGILSHAAIVAREMQKPCVIATKNATKTFVDGDKVEVDGDTGIVKKI